MPNAVTPFRVEIPEAELADLRDRLRRTRWPEPETVSDWSQGVPLAYLRELCCYWAEEYDWRATEARLNALPQFRTEVDGLGIHFVHLRSRHTGALPLVMTHGWSGSIVEFLKVLAPLTDPTAYGGEAADAVHVVCPSPPGYGFSDKPVRAGWGIERIADAWCELMTRLGYERFGAQGSDWGTSVAACIGQQHPDRVAGIHLMPPLAPPDPDTFGDLTDAERAALDSLREADEWGSGYSAQQSTRPQISATGASRPRAVTSPRSSSRRCSSTRSGPSSGWSAGLAWDHDVLAVDDRRQRPRSAGAVLGAGARLPAGPAEGAGDHLARALCRPAGRGAAFEDRLFDPAGLRPPIWFQKEGKFGEPRTDEQLLPHVVHLDINVGDGRNAEHHEIDVEVQRLVGLGATVIRKYDETWGLSPEYHYVMADPGGHDFCVQ